MMKGHSERRWKSLVFSRKNVCIALMALGLLAIVSVSWVKLDRIHSNRYNNISSPPPAVKDYTNHLSHEISRDSSKNNKPPQNTKQKRSSSPNGSSVTDAKANNRSPSRGVPTAQGTKARDNSDLKEYTDHLAESTRNTRMADDCEGYPYCEENSKKRVAPRESGSGSSPKRDEKRSGREEGTDVDVNLGEYRRERMDAYLAERAKCDDTRFPSAWIAIDMDANNIEYEQTYQQSYPATSSDPKKDQTTGLTVCEVDDETANSGWIFTRVGPFVGRGGYDWHKGGIHSMPRNPEAKFITAKMFAPVAEDGRILGYPPIHAHHVHMGLDTNGHWFDSHGDSICSEELGGTACYLREQPAGYGFPLLESDIYDLDYMLNDVRELGSPPMVFYLETSMRWSTDEELTPVARASLNYLDTRNDPYKHVFKTVLFPTEDSVSWHTGKWLMDGKVIYSPKDQTPWLHSHRSFLKGMWAFAAGPEDLGLTLDLLEQTPQESVPASSDEKSYPIDQCWIPRNQDPHEALFDRIKNSKAGMEALRCWLNPSNEEKTLEFVKGTDTSLQYPEAWQQNWEETYYDRVGQVHCDPWSFKKGDNYTVVAINGLRDELADLDKPNLQHIGFKLEYEALDDGLMPFNFEVLGSYLQNFSTPEGLVKPKYSLSVSYMNCFLTGEGCTIPEVNAFAEWYYKDMDAGNASLGCDESEKSSSEGKDCQSLKRELQHKAIDKLRNEFNITGAIGSVHDHAQSPLSH